MIKVKNLNKYYNKGKSNQIHVINDTSLELPSNGLISFLGHSGSGKTTLLNVIGGLDKATGSITYDDLEINKYNMHKIDEFRSKHIGYVFQNYNLLKSETVYDNLKIALEVIGVTNLEEIDKRIEYTLKAVGMYKYRKKKAYALSGGQQQRVSIARALVKNCKIIIADEPTGNLDSNNTIEVMKILKKISKHTLVLMVTHETDIADFYSDYIFELKDGSIINQNDNSGDKSLKRDDSNTVYLKDMNKNEYETSIGSINVYTDDNEFNSASINFIIKNGTIFINSAQNIKLVNNSNLKIVDGHYEDIKSNDVDDFKYDTSWYRDLKENKHFIKKFLLMLKSSFLSLKNVKKRIKFLYLSLACIGLVWAISVVAIANGTNVDISNFSYNESYITISETGYLHSIDTALEKLVDSKLINDGKRLYDATLNYSRNLTYNYKIGYTVDVRVSYYEQEYVSIFKGEAPQNDNEILISLSVADKIIEGTKRILNYDSLLGENVTIASEDYKICGFTDKDNKMVYVTEDKYFYTVGCGNCFSNHIVQPYWLADSRDFRFAGNEVNSKGEKLYSIVAGRDVDLESSENEALISIEEYNNFSKNESLDNYIVEVNGEEYKAVGVFNYPYKYQDMYILNKVVKRYLNDYYCKYFNSDKYEVVEGRMNNAENEVLVPSYSNIEIGEKIMGDTIVVGKFASDYDIMKCVIGSKLDALKSDRNYNAIVAIEADDFSKVNEVLVDYLYKCDYMKDSIVDEQLFYMRDVNNVFIILSIVLGAVSSIFIYFIMRSRMISDIYNIGVYRSLGAKRSKLYFKNIVDIFILTTVTSLLGYCIGIIGYNAIAEMVNDMVSSNVLMKCNIIFILGGAAIYVLMIIFGMLPILTLLRKTPSEICTKYDI